MSVVVFSHLITLYFFVILAVHLNCYLFFSFFKEVRIEEKRYFNEASSFLWQDSKMIAKNTRLIIWIHKSRRHTCLKQNKHQAVSFGFAVALKLSLLLQNYQHHFLSLLSQSCNYIFLSPFGRHPHPVCTVKETMYFHISFYWYTFVISLNSKTWSSSML